MVRYFPPSAVAPSLVVLDLAGVVPTCSNTVVVMITSCWVFGHEESQYTEHVVDLNSLSHSSVPAMLSLPESKCSICLVAQKKLY